MKAFFALLIALAVAGSSSARVEEDLAEVMAPAPASDPWEAEVFNERRSSRSSSAPVEGRHGIWSAFAFGVAPWYIYLLVVVGSLALAASIVAFIVAFSVLKKRNETAEQVKEDLKSNKKPKAAIITGIACLAGSIFCFGLAAGLAARIPVQ